MATWSEVKNYIRSNYIVAAEDSGFMRLQFDTGDARSQVIYVMGIETGDEMASVRFFSPFAQVDDISPSQLVEVVRGAIFGVAEIADLYGHVHSSFLADLDASEIHVPMSAVTSEADRTERLLGLGDRL